jgi:hypothetical protein
MTLISAFPRLLITRIAADAVAISRVTRLMYTSQHDPMLVLNDATGNSGGVHRYPRLQLAFSDTRFRCRYFSLYLQRLRLGVLYHHATVSGGL